MSVRVMKIDTPAEAKAEGLCGGVPYDTQLVNINGVNIHFWLGDTEPFGEQLAKLVRIAQRNRDIVSATWSPGHPTGFWAHENMRTG